MGTAQGEGDGASPALLLGTCSAPRGQTWIAVEKSSPLHGDGGCGQDLCQARVLIKQMVASV